MEINANADVKAGLETEHILDVSDRLYKLLAGIIIGSVVLGLGFLLSELKGLPENVAHEISFTGEGKAVAKPDIASVILGVSSKGLKSQEVVNDNNKKMNDVIKAVKEAGVADKDIKTIVYNLTPIYDYSETPVRMGAMMPEYQGSTFKGYSLEQQIEVKIRDFDNINVILDKATASGANTVGNLQFSVDDMEKVKAEARLDAIKQAKQKANSLAGQSGLSLGKLVNVAEGYNYYPMAYGLGKAESVAMDSTVAPNVQPGQQEFTITVTLTYQVR